MNAVDLAMEAIHREQRHAGETRRAESQRLWGHPGSIAGGKAGQPPTLRECVRLALRVNGVEC